METERTEFGPARYLWNWIGIGSIFSGGSRDRVPLVGAANGRSLFSIPGLPLSHPPRLSIGTAWPVRADAIRRELAPLRLRTSRMARRDCMWLCLPGLGALEETAWRCHHRPRHH